jgi:type IV pilus assembly protein PilB
VPRQPRLGDILVQAGLIDELQLHTALAEQERWGNRLGVALVKLGMIDEQELLRALSRKLGAPAVRLQGKRIDPAVLALVPRDLAQRHACLPLFTKQEAGVEVIYIGMEDPGDLTALDELGFRTGLKVRPVIVAPTELWETLDRSYGGLAEAPEAPQSETPTDPADTAPHFVSLGSETRDDRDALLPRSKAPAPVPATPVEGARARSDAPPQEGAAAPSSGSGASPVPTRSILRALTQLLLEKELIDRDELLRRIQAVEERSE